MGRPRKQPAPEQFESTEQAVVATQKKKRNRPDLANYGHEYAKPGDNARYIRSALVSMDLPPIDISDPQQVDNRLREYFEWCVQNDEKPLVSGMANWLGISRKQLEEWKNGAWRKDTHCSIIKKYYGALEQLWEKYMSDGTINTVSGIFLGKVMFGYRETSEVVVTPNNNLGVAETDRTLTERYMDIVDVQDVGQENEQQTE